MRSSNVSIAPKRFYNVIIGSVFFNLMGLQHQNHSFLMTKSEFTDLFIICCISYFKTKLFLLWLGILIPFKNILIILDIVCHLNHRTLGSIYFCYFHFYRWGNWSLKTIGNLSKFTTPLSSKLGNTIFWTDHKVCPPNQHSLLWYW